MIPGFIDVRTEWPNRSLTIAARELTEVGGIRPEHSVNQLGLLERARTFASILSLIFLTSSSDFPFGSARFQSMSFFRIFARTGREQTSSTEHPIVTTRSASSITSFVSIFGLFCEMSISSSLIARTTVGLTFGAGTVPALDAIRPYFRAKASAIWLRPAFPTQTNKIERFASSFM